MFKVQGKIETIFEAQQITEKFKKREFVLEVQNGKYPEYIKFQLVQDRTALIDGFKPGQLAEVSFNLRGRPYNKGGETIYFTNLEAWRITGAQVQHPEQQGAIDSLADEIALNNASDDDLPF